MAIRCGVLIDGIADETFEDQLVIIRDGRFERISEFAQPPEDMVFLDLGDYTCMPGLINTHVHLADVPYYTHDYSIYYGLTEEKLAQTATENAATNLMTGFTTVRNVGDYYPEPVYDIRREIRAGTATGPRIQTAGPYLTIPGGGGDIGGLSRRSRGPRATRAWRSLAVSRGAPGRARHGRGAGAVNRRRWR